MLLTDCENRHKPRIVLLQPGHDIDDSIHEKVRLQVVMNLLEIFRQRLKTDKKIV